MPDDESNERVPAPAERLVLVFLTKHSRWQYNLGKQLVLRTPRDTESPSPFLGYDEDWEPAVLSSGLQLGSQVYFTGWLGHEGMRGYLQSGVVESIELQFV